MHSTVLPSFWLSLKFKSINKSGIRMEEALKFAQSERCFVGQNVIDGVTNPRIASLQQIAGYTAGIDYPNYSEVPQGGTFSCQNRLPGKYCDWLLRQVGSNLGHLTPTSDNTKNHRRKEQHWGMLKARNTFWMSLFLPRFWCAQVMRWWLKSHLWWWELMMSLTDWIKVQSEWANRQFSSLFGEVAELA